MSRHSGRRLRAACVRATIALLVAIVAPCAALAQPAAVALGSPSQPLHGDSRTSGAEWNEFYHSPVGLFEPMHAYNISLDYKVLSRDRGADFYMLLRSKSRSAPDDAWQQWRGSAGQSGHKQITVVVRNTADYRLVLGIENKGAIDISRLTIVPDPADDPLEIEMPRIETTWTAPQNTTYYVDSTSGSDANSGLSPASAWGTMARVDTGKFTAGDRVLLRRGSSWSGALTISAAGSNTAPVMIGPYGAGPMPRIDAQGLVLAAVDVYNSTYIVVRDLDIANHGRVPQPLLTGVTVEEQNFGTARGIVLDGLYVHDVTGSDDKSQGGGAGINCVCDGSSVPTRFDGLTIEHCRLRHTDRNGITMYGPWQRTKWYPSLHVVIKDNRLDDIGGDGIVPIACDGAVISHNVLHGGRMRAQDYAAGIWPWGCDNTLIEYNTVTGMRGTNDGEGYDSDWDCRGSIFQYNTSSHNDGGFMLICDDGSSKPPDNAGNVGTIIRYNISIDDGDHTFNISGPITDARIYNNVFYAGVKTTPTCIASGNWGGGWPSGVKFANNIFDYKNKAGIDLGGMTDVRFTNNLFWGAIAPPLGAIGSVVGDPQLTKPGGRSAFDYRPLPTSPCLGAGTAVDDAGVADFAGEMIGPHLRPSIGAFQEPGSDWPAVTPKALTSPTVPVVMSRPNPKSR